MPESIPGNIMPGQTCIMSTNLPPSEANAAAKKLEIAPTMSITTRLTRSGRNIIYRLTVIQQPARARACGSGSKAQTDRRPIDPPPVCELRIFEGDPAGMDPKDAPTCRDITFEYSANFFMFATLEHSRPMAHGRVSHATATPPVLSGMPVSGMAYLDRPLEAGYFLFPDLSVRHEGRYRLVFNLYEQIKNESDFDVEPDMMMMMGGGGGASSTCVQPPPPPCGTFDHRIEIKTIAFDVYSAKRFPGLKQSTKLSKIVADQGCRVRIRREIRMRKRDVKGEVVDGDDAKDGDDESNYSRDVTTDGPSPASSTPTSSTPTSSNPYHQYQQQQQQQKPHQPNYQPNYQSQSRPRSMSNASEMSRAAMPGAHDHPVAADNQRQPSQHDEYAAATPRPSSTYPQIVHSTDKGGHNSRYASSSSYPTAPPHQQQYQPPQQHQQHEYQSQHQQQQHEYQPHQHQQHQHQQYQYPPQPPRLHTPLPPTSALAQLANAATLPPPITSTTSGSLSDYSSHHQTSLAPSSRTDLPPYNLSLDCDRRSSPHSASSFPPPPPSYRGPDMPSLSLPSLTSAVSFNRPPPSVPLQPQPRLIAPRPPSLNRHAFNFKSKIEPQAVYMEMPPMVPSAHPRVLAPALTTMSAAIEARSTDDDAADAAAALAAATRAGQKRRFDTVFDVAESPLRDGQRPPEARHVVSAIDGIDWEHDPHAYKRAGYDYSMVFFRSDGTLGERQAVMHF